MDDNEKTCRKCLHFVVCGHNLSVKNEVIEITYKRMGCMGSRDPDKHSEAIIDAITAISKIPFTKDEKLIKDFRNVLFIGVDNFLAYICKDYLKLVAPEENKTE